MFSIKVELNANGPISFTLSDMVILDMREESKACSPITSSPSGKVTKFMSCFD